MAYIKFSDGTSTTTNHEFAERIWSVLISEVEGNEEENEYASRVHKIYLNWRKAPDTYLIAKRKLVEPMVRNYFVVDLNGNPLYPDPHDLDCKRVTKLYRSLHHM